MKRLSVTSQIIEKASSQLAANFEDIEKMFSNSPAPAAVGR
jgi:hypothetical protein